MSTRNLDNHIDLFMEPVIECRPWPIVRQFQIEMAEDLGYKLVKFDQRDLISLVLAT